MSKDRRCGAPTQAGRPCKRRPVKGGERCTAHKAGGPPAGPYTHGAFSKRFKRLSESGQQSLGELLADPELLDAKRPVAVATHMLLGMDLEPDDASIMLLAKTYCMPGHEPTMVEIARARHELLRPVQRQVELLGKQQYAAHRQAKLSELLLAECIPIFELLGKAAFDLCEKYVSDPELRTKFMDAWRGHVAAAAARLTAVDVK